jgi:hypothetical protein
MTPYPKTQNKHVQLLNRRNVILLVCGLILVLAVILLAPLFMQPQRSVASFCRVAKEQKAILTGDVSYEKQLDAYKKLEAVSPDDIRSDITTIRKGYESIVQNPSNTISAGLGMSGAENRRSDYIAKNCPDF